MEIVRRSIGIALVAVLILAGCGIGGNDATPTTAPPATPQTIGTPRATATVAAGVATPSVTPPTGTMPSESATTAPPATPQTTGTPRATATVSAVATPGVTPPAGTMPPGSATTTPAGPPQVTTVTDGVSMPNALAFTPDGRLLFNEVYEGRIRVVQDGQLLPEPFAQLDVAQPPGYTEHGLLGLAIDPDFAQNHYVYAFYTFPDRSGNPAGQRIVRFTDRDNVGTDLTVIVDDLPAGPDCCHNGGRIQFGPDGALYVTLGDTENADLSQQVDAVAGRILRYRPDGTIPPDNPFPDNPTYAYGLRNPFGIRFHPLTGKLFATENGPSGQDELNIIEPGQNYGWPIVTGAVGDDRFTDPIWTSDGSHAPTGLEIPNSPVLPDLTGDVVFCEWNTGTLQRFRLAKPGYDRVESQETLPGTCRLDVTQGPDGALYFSDEGAIYRYGP